MAQAKGIRIQKVLSDNGIMSRRKAEEAIQQGRITVNGHPAVPGNPVNPMRDVIAVDGVRVRLQKKKKNYYIMMHKPRGYVTTTSDEMGRKCVTDLLEDAPARVYPVQHIRAVRLYPLLPGPAVLLHNSGGKHQLNIGNPLAILHWN